MKIKKVFNKRLDGLAAVTEPVFGILSLRILLMCTIYLVADAHLNYAHYEKGETVSVIGYVLPAAFFQSEAVFEFCRIGFYISATCWFFLRLSPVSGWATVLFFTLTASIFWENLPWFRHKYLIPNWILIVYAMWFQFYGKDIRLARENGRLWGTPLCPGWVFELSIYSIALFYSFAGFSKWLSCGVAWGDGLSLQLWIDSFGESDVIVARSMLQDRRIAMVLHTGALFLELFAFVAVIVPRSRALLGASVVLLHISIDQTFGIDFRTNAILVAVYFLPMESSIGNVIAQIKAWATDTTRSQAFETQTAILNVKQTAET